MKQKIRLTESDLHRIVNASVKKVLNEDATLSGNKVAQLISFEIESIQEAINDVRSEVPNIDTYAETLCETIEDSINSIKKYLSYIY